MSFRIIPRWTSSSKHNTRCKNSASFNANFLAFKKVRGCQLESNVCVIVPALWSLPRIQKFDGKDPVLYLELQWRVLGDWWKIYSMLLTIDISWNSAPWVLISSGFLCFQSIHYEQVGRGALWRHVIITDNVIWRFSRLLRIPRRPVFSLGRIPTVAYG